MKKKTIILGIESSCDETAVAVIKENEQILLKFYQVLFQVK